MSCLMYLPSMTEETESLRLLEKAYPALIGLTRIRRQDQRYPPPKIEAMDRVMCSGILKGYAQAGEHVKIAEFLVNRMEEVVNEMGIDVVMYLKVIIFFPQVQTFLG